MSPNKRILASSSDKSKEEQTGPNINSSNPEERKLARRLRLQNRLHVNRVSEDSSPNGISEGHSKTPVELQVEKSGKVLEKFLREGNIYLDNMCLANKARQAERRVTDNATKQKILSDLEAHAMKSELKFNEIVNKWIGLKDLNDPLEINEAILHQKIKCEELIRDKNDFMEKIKLEVAKVEKQFQKDLAKQHEDIEILSERIDLQIKLMIKAFQKQFTIIDKVVNMEKDDFIKNNNEIWDDLYHDYNENDTENCEYKLRKQSSIKASLDDNQFNFEEELRLTKTTLNHDVQEAQHELERIKVLTLSNLEKFIYSFQLLLSRENENLLIKAEQKRKITKVKDHLTSLSKELRSYRGNTIEHIKKLMSDIKKSHKHILDVEDKANYFAKTNDKKFHQLWKLNKNHAMGILHKIFAIDNILHQQQMGVLGNPPNYRNIDLHIMPSYQYAINIMQSLNQTDGDASRISTAPVESTIQDGLTKKSVDGVESDTDVMDANVPYRNVVKNILTILSDKGGFLTEKRLKAIINCYEDNNRALVRLSNVFDSLHISKPEEIDILVNYFMPYSYCTFCGEKGSGGPISSLDVGKGYSLVTSHASVKSELSHQVAYSSFLLELEEAFEAIQQPNYVFEEILLELVDSQLSIDQKPLLDKSLSAELLKQEFDKYNAEAKEKKTAKKKAIYTEEKFLCKYRHPLVISSIYIMTALKEFVTSYYCRNTKYPTTAERINYRRNTLSRLIHDKDIMLFWKTVKDVYNKEHERIWNGLETGIKKYHELLTQRKALCEEILDLRKKNHQLKSLLNVYMSHKPDLISPCKLELDVIPKSNGELRI